MLPIFCYIVNKDHLPKPNKNHNYYHFYMLILEQKDHEAWRLVKISFSVARPNNSLNFLSKSERAII
jgi:hypothetical protein